MLRCHTILLYKNTFLPLLRACRNTLQMHQMPPQQNTLTTIPSWLILMGLLTAIGPLAIDMYLPAFPAIAQGLGATHGDVERTLASYLLGLALAQLFYGQLADRYGRKKKIGSASCRERVCQYV